MRAAILRTLNGDLEVRDDVELDSPRLGEVRVKLTASGLCHSDASVRNGSLRASLPCVLGHEGAGIVVDVGDDVGNIQVGDHVVIASIPACLTCPTCLRGEPNLCAVGERKPLGARFNVGGEAVTGVFGCGTLAEEVIVSGHATVPIDRDIPLDLAALIGCCVTTGVGAALRSARVTPGSTVVVFGIGGVGVAAIQGARIAGAAEILAVDPVEKKHDWARGFGATAAVTPDLLEDAIRDITGGEGFDFALECAGSAVAVRQAYDAIRRGGSAVVVGVASPDAIVSFNAFELFFSEKSLRGSVYGGTHARVDFNRYVRLWREGRLDLEGMVSRRLPLDDINDAFRALHAGEVIRSLVMFG